MFFEQHRVPVQSCLLSASADAASGIAYGNIELIACNQCGLVFNRAFDPQTQEFSPYYEETQGFSPAFQRFSESLVADLDTRWNLLDRTVIEVGCGKGEFLDLLSARSGCRGLGIDPAYDPERRPSLAGDAVRYEQRLFSADDIGRLRGDYLVCRHTLEHIGPVNQFLELIRQACLAGRIREVFIEIPESERIFAEGAFWDIYYEHANYFTETALAHAMHEAGFEVLTMQRLFHDQYLGVYARPVESVHDQSMPVNMPSSDKLHETLALWRKRLAEMAAPAVIWGSGSKGVSFLSHADRDHNVAAAIDINPFRHERYMPGSATPILSPESLKDIDPAHIIVMNPVYLEEIAAQVKALGLSPEITAL